MSELIAELKKLKKTCLKAVPIPASSISGSETECRLAGAAYAEKNDETPICPECKRPLSFVFQFKDEANKRLVVLYYCFYCMPIGTSDETKGCWVIKTYENPDSTKFKNGIGVDNKLTACVCKLEKIELLPDYETIENNFANIAKMCEQADEEDPMAAYEDACASIGVEIGPKTIIGGCPQWVQGEAEKTCKCGQKMQFLAQVDSESDANLMWGDAGSLYIFNCPEHKNEFDIEMQCF